MLLRTAKSCGPDALTLASSFVEANRWLNRARLAANPRGDGGKRARSPGSTKEAVKTIAQGKPVWTGEPVVPTHVLSTFARGAAGASDTRLSLRPLSFGGTKTRHDPGASRRGNECAYVAQLFEKSRHQRCHQVRRRPLQYSPWPY